MTTLGSDEATGPSGMSPFRFADVSESGTFDPDDLPMQVAGISMSTESSTRLGLGLGLDMRVGARTDTLSSLDEYGLNLMIQDESMGSAGMLIMGSTAAASTALLSASHAHLYRLNEGGEANAENQTITASESELATSILTEAQLEAQQTVQAERELELRRQSLLENLIGMGFPMEWALRAAEHADASASESTAITWIIDRMELDQAKMAGMNDGSIDEMDRDRQGDHMDRTALHSGVGLGIGIGAGIGQSTSNRDESTGESNDQTRSAGLYSDHASLGSAGVGNSGGGRGREAGQGSTQFVTDNPLLDRASANGDRSHSLAADGRGASGQSYSLSTNAVQATISQESKFLMSLLNENGNETGEAENRGNSELTDLALLDSNLGHGVWNDDVTFSPVLAGRYTARRRHDGDKQEVLSQITDLEAADMCPIIGSCQFALCVLYARAISTRCLSISSQLETAVADKIGETSAATPASTSASLGKPVSEEFEENSQHSQQASREVSAALSTVLKPIRELGDSLFSILMADCGISTVADLLKLCFKQCIANAALAERLFPSILHGSIAGDIRDRLPNLYPFTSQSQTHFFQQLSAAERTYFARSIGALVIEETYVQTIVSIEAFLRKIALLSAVGLPATASAAAVFPQLLESSPGVGGLNNRSAGNIDEKCSATSTSADATVTIDNNATPSSPTITTTAAVDADIQDSGSNNIKRSLFTTQATATLMPSTTVTHAAATQHTDTCRSLVSALAEESICMIEKAAAPAHNRRDWFTSQGVGLQESDGETLESETATATMQDVASPKSCAKIFFTKPFILWAHFLLRRLLVTLYEDLPIPICQESSDEHISLERSNGHILTGSNIPIAGTTRSSFSDHINAEVQTSQPMDGASLLLARLACVCPPLALSRLIRSSTSPNMSLKYCINDVSALALGAVIAALKLSSSSRLPDARMASIRDTASSYSVSLVMERHLLTLFTSRLRSENTTRRLASKYTQSSARLSSQLLLLRRSWAELWGDVSWHVEGLGGRTASRGIGLPHSSGEPNLPHPLFLFRPQPSRSFELDQMNVGTDIFVRSSSTSSHPASTEMQSDNQQKSKSVVFSRLLQEEVLADWHYCCWLESDGFADPKYAAKGAEYSPYPGRVGNPWTVRLFVSHISCSSITISWQLASGAGSTTCGVARDTAALVDKPDTVVAISDPVYAPAAISCSSSAAKSEVDAKSSSPVSAKLSQYSVRPDARTLPPVSLTLLLAPVSTLGSETPRIVATNLCTGTKS